VATGNGSGVPDEGGEEGGNGEKDTLRERVTVEAAQDASSTSANGGVSECRWACEWDASSMESSCDLSLAMLAAPGLLVAVSLT
jgi:hypothetical protein